MLKIFKWKQEDKIAIAMAKDVDEARKSLRYKILGTANIEFAIFVQNTNPEIIDKNAGETGIIFIDECDEGKFKGLTGSSAQCLCGSSLLIFGDGKVKCLSCGGRWNL